MVLGHAQFLVVQSFCHLACVWCDFAVITGLSYHTETQCSLRQLYEVYRTRVDLCSLGWRFTRLSVLSCCCAKVRLAYWIGGRFVSWGVSLEITFIFYYRLMLRWKKWQVDQWERPVLYWLSFIRRFEVFWSINKQESGVIIYTFSSQNCPSISYTVL